MARRVILIVFILAVLCIVPWISVRHGSFILDTASDPEVFGSLTPRISETVSDEIVSTPFGSSDRYADAIGSTLAPSESPEDTVAVLISGSTVGPFPEITPVSTCVPTVAPAETSEPTAFVMSSPTPVAAPVVTPEPVFTSVPSATLSPVFTSVPIATSVPTVSPVPTAAPTAAPTPSATPVGHIVDTSKRYNVTLVDVPLTEFENDIISDILSMSLNGGGSGQAVLYRYVNGLTSEQCSRIVRDLHAYLSSYYFPTVCALISYPEYTLSPVYDMPIDLAYYGECMLIGYCYNNSSGRLALLFQPERIRLMINEHAYNMRKIDELLDGISSGSEEVVAKKIALALIRNRSYKNGDRSVYELFAHSYGNCCSFSLAFRTACRRVGLQCDHHEGNWNGKGHAWCSIRFSDNGTRLYYDLARARASSSPECYLGMTGDAMSGYHRFALENHIIYWNFPVQFLE